MTYTGNTTYRPPVEAALGTKLLQVTVGCSHNACTFCTMYRDVKFSVDKMEQVENDLKELRATYSSIDRIFLLNGDVFCLSFNKLKTLSDLIIKYIPEVKVITMYCSITNIKNKSDDDLSKMKDLRINDLWMGCETGNSDALKHINKGHTLEEAYEQLERLNKFDIHHDDGYMFGCGGKGAGIEGAIDTAKLINISKPTIIWFGTLGLFEGSEMHQQMLDGTFIPATEREILEEEIKLLELLEVENVPFYGIHPTNVGSVQGILPKDRDAMISKIRRVLDETADELLDNAKSRDTL